MKKYTLLVGLLFCTNATASVIQDHEIYTMFGAGFNNDNTQFQFTPGFQISNRWYLESTMLFDYDIDMYSYSSNSKLNQSTDSFSVSLTPLFMYPISEYFSSYAKLGGYFAKYKSTRNDESNNSLQLIEKYSKDGITFGVGLQYTTTEPTMGETMLSARLGADWYNKGYTPKHLDKRPVIGIQMGLVF